MFFFFKQKTAYEIGVRLVGSEMCIRDRYEILAAMDAYITDYSSACFEAGFAHIPVFIYADDIEKLSLIHI